ncbi:MAG: alpha/beta fold hydrolase [Naasia sp.]|nr:alpha/beta fold hydrolase [Naasia sp.]
MGRRTRALPSVAVAIGSVATAGLLFAGAVTASVARTVLRPPRRAEHDIRVVAVDRNAGTVVLTATVDALLPGDYSFWFGEEAEHARLGEILDRSHGTVTRRLIAVDSGDFVPGVRGRISGWFHLHPGELGVPVEDVRVRTSLGNAPAWQIPAEQPTRRWVIQVHGRATLRQEAIRAIPVFRAAGWTSLLISYRNDGEAPPSPDRRYALGDVEWLDVEAAVLYALDQGAEQVVLMGWSMGGTTVLQAATRSGLADVITGVVLDSPVINWTDTLRYQGEAASLPGPVQAGALRLISSRWARPVTGQDQPIDLDRLDFIARADELDVPILIMHSDDDGFVPVNGSRELAAARPDIVTFVPFAGARHCKLWNYDRERWEGAITQWLDRLEARPSSGAEPESGQASDQRP